MQTIYRVRYRCTVCDKTARTWDVTKEKGAGPAVTRMAKKARQHIDYNHDDHDKNDEANWSLEYEAMHVGPAGEGSPQTAAQPDSDAARAAAPQQVRVPIRAPEHEYIASNGEYEDVKDLLAASQDLAFIGPTGSGKTTLAENVAYDLERPLYEVQGHGRHTKGTLIGQWKAVADGHGGTDMVWQDGQIVRAMRDERDPILYVDEPNMLPADVVPFLRSLTDDRRHISIPETGETVTVADGFAVVLAWNEGREYHGAANMNLADRDRPDKFFKIDYLPEAREARLLVDRTGIDRDSADRMVAIANESREQYEQDVLRIALSTRRLLQWADGIAQQGWAPMKAFRHAVQFWVPDRLEADRKELFDLAEARFGEDVSDY